MKNYQFIVLNIIGVFFSYAALGMLIYWVFKVEIYLPLELKRSIYIAMGTVFLLPIISFVNIKFGNKRKVSILLGFVYLSLWLIVLVRLVTQLN